MIAVAAREVEPALFGNRFQDSRFTAAVLADQKGDVGLECYAQPAGDTWNIKRMPPGIDALRKSSDASKERHSIACAWQRALRAALQVCAGRLLTRKDRRIPIRQIRCCSV